MSYIKLELGAGEHPSMGGFVHNDIVAYPHIEIVCDCAHLPMIETGSVTILRAIHLLEHFGPWDGPETLAEWVRVLCPRGVLEVAMPNLQELALMVILENITLEAFWRDVYGLAARPQVTIAQQWDWVKRLTQGYSIAHYEVWINLLHEIYEPIWKTQGHVPQAHKWAFCDQHLRMALGIAMGADTAVIHHEGTSLHAWVTKPDRRSSR